MAGETSKLPAVPCGACGKPASALCSGCNLIKYCSKECQVSNRSAHRSTCESVGLNGKSTWLPAWVRERRQPAFIDDDKAPHRDMATYAVSHGMRKYLCGNMPAFDHISFAGVKCRETLDVLFAASGDLRNMIVSIIGLADGNGAVATNVVINDFEPYVVVRSLLFSLILGSDAENQLKVDTCIHLWYSAFMTKEMVKLVCESWKKNLSKMESAVYKHGADENGLIATKVTLEGGALVRIAFSRKVWKLCFVIVNTFERKANEKGAKKDASKARHEVTMHPTRVDYRDRFLLCIRGKWRMPMQRFFEDGMVLPYGANRENYVVPNCTLFDASSGAWQLMDSYKPVDSWPVRTFINANDARPGASRVGESDIMGMLYMQIFETLSAFSAKLQDMGSTLTFVLACENATALRTFLPKLSSAPRKFDVIDVSNVTDAGNTYLGVQTTLSKIAVPLLKENGILISLFMNHLNNVDQAKSMSGLGNPRAEILFACEKAKNYFGTVIMRKALEVEGVPPSSLDPASATARFMSLANMFRDLDKIWKEFIAMLGIPADASRNGMRIKKTVRPFQIKLEGRRNKMEVLEEFNDIQLADIPEHATYVLWEKV